MGIMGNTSQNTLPEFQKYLLERKLAPEKHIPFLAFWVSKFLGFSGKKAVNAAQYSEQTVIEFLETLRSDSRTTDWQIRQADNYIKPRTPRLNGKVERSHSTDQREFYQLLTYKDDVDLNKKLQEWASYYNLHRPHGGLKGKTPYEALRERIQDSKEVSAQV
jgi:hypothetical protein